MPERESETKGIFTHKTYDRLKFVALVLLPALGTLYFTVAALWGLAHTTEVVGTITAIDTFLGVVLQLSSNSYYKNGRNFDGTMTVKETEAATQFALELNGDPADLPGKHSVEFNVQKVNES